MSDKMAVHYSAKTPIWETPQDLFDQLNAEFQFNLDPCALPENAKCERYFTPEEDGLSQTCDDCPFIEMHCEGQSCSRPDMDHHWLENMTGEPPVDCPLPEYTPKDENYNRYMRKRWSVKARRVWGVKEGVFIYRYPEIHTGVGV